MGASLSCGRGIGRHPRTQVVRTARTVGSLPAGIAWDPTHSAPHAAGHYRGDVCPVETQFLVPHNLRGTILKELGHGFWTLRAASPHPFDEVGRARARALGHGVTLAPNGREIDIFDGSSGVCVSWYLSENGQPGGGATRAEPVFPARREAGHRGALPARHGGWGARATRRNSHRNSVHKRSKTAPRGRFRQSVYTPASPRLSTTSQQCTQMPQTGSERPFSPICVHSASPRPLARPGGATGPMTSTTPWPPRCQGART